MWRKENWFLWVINYFSEGYKKDRFLTLRLSSHAFGRLFMIHWIKNFIISQNSCIECTECSLLVVNKRTVCILWRSHKPAKFPGSIYFLPFHGRGEERDEGKKRLGRNKKIKESAWEGWRLQMRTRREVNGVSCLVNLVLLGPRKSDEKTLYKE